jgi:hypothetical protein
MAAAEADTETAAALRAEVATLRTRVQVWNPSRTCDCACYVCLRLVVAMSLVLFSPPN